MSESDLITRLRACLRDEQVLTAVEDLAVYAYDGTARLNQPPACVVLPESAAEVAEVMKIARQAETSVVVRGSGTGLAGGSVPVPGSLVVCLARMNRILEVDTHNLTLTAEAGVITQTIADRAAEVGLFYPPDPASLKISTIGGNVANNSGGLRGLKYGVTRDYVMALEVVLTDGRILRTGTKCVKDVAGFRLKDLFIASEGTLGVITEVTLKLIPPPASRKTLLALFNRMTDAAETVSQIIAHKIIPCTLEFLDKITIECVEEYAHIGLPLDCEAVVLMETDGHPAEVEEQARAMQDIAREQGAREVRIAASAEEADELAAARRTAFSALARLAPTVLLEDVTVPRGELARMVAFIQEAAQRHQVRIGTFGHMGDGNLHPTFLTDERNSEELERAEAAMKEVFEQAVALGGTITGEHGVGLAKKPYLPGQLGEVALDVTRRLRQVFDPQEILNPGKVLD